MMKRDLELLLTGRMLSAKAYAVIFLAGVLVGVLLKILL